MRWLMAMCAVGCGGSVPTFTEDVQPILEGRCVTCHQQGSIAPFALTSYDDVVAVAPLVAASVADGSMPPWPAAPGHVDYVRDPSLTDAQVAAIVAWADGGMPQGDADAVVEPLARLAVELPRVDRTLMMPEPYTPTKSPDEYRCFILDWDAEETSYIVGYDTFPDNHSIVHHVTAFLIRPDTLLGDSVFGTLEGWDAADEAPGYSCFGGPGGEEDLQMPVQQLGAWVPGAGAARFPEGSGIEVPAGSKVVLQLHYNTATADGAPDQSSLAFMVEDTVERRGGFAPWLDPAWVVAGMDIPAGRSITHDAVGSPYGFFDIVLGGSLDLAAGFEIHSVMLHMHRLGASASTSLHRADGAEQLLLEIPEWDFDWQLTYGLETPVTVGPDDELEVRCTWDNSHGAEDVAWGEGSDEEMCVANFFVTELP